jgi:hypothetical protein
MTDLMKTFMQSQELSFMPEFIQEVGDFKSFVKDYQCDGRERLIGLGRCSFLGSMWTTTGSLL